MSAAPDLRWATRNAASAAEWLNRAAGAWERRAAVAIKKFEEEWYGDTEPDWEPEDGDELEATVSCGDLAELVVGLRQAARLLRACAEVVPEVPDQPGGAGTDVRVAQIEEGGAP
jgi:hypothetical protein